MMKRFFLLLLLLALLPAASLYGQDEAGLASLGDELPTVDLYIGLRTDSAFVEIVDNLLLRVTSGVPGNIVPSLRLRDAIAYALNLDGAIDIVSLVLPWLGDQAAVGITGFANLIDEDSTNDDDITLYLIAEMRSRLLAEAFLLTAGLPEGTRRSVVDDVVRYQSESDQLEIVLDRQYLRLISGPAATEVIGQGEAFEAAMDALPQAPDTYDVVVFERAAAPLRVIAEDPALFELLSAFGLALPDLDASAAGLVLNESRLQLDVSQLRSGNAVPVEASLNPDFAARFPDNSTLVAHGVDLSRLLRGVAGVIASISASDTSESVYERFESLSQLLLGLDLEADILPLVTSDYGIFLISPESDNIASNNGLEATAFVTTVSDGNVAWQRLQQANDTLRRVFADDFEVLSDQLPDGQEIVRYRPIHAVDGQQDLQAGVIDNTLFLGTPFATDALLSDGGGFDTTDLYQRSQSFSLTDAQVAIYVEGQGAARLLLLADVLAEPLQATLGGADILQATVESVESLVQGGMITQAYTPENDLLVRVLLLLHPADTE